MRAPKKRRFLVCYDYGMGGLWWWITASSDEEILDTFAEVEVVSDPESLGRVGSWDPPLAEVSIAGPYPPGLDQLHAKRSAQRAQPGYGELAGADRVWLKRQDPDDKSVVWFTELGPDGRRLREVVIRADGAGVRRSRWVKNPPEDLRNPSLGQDVCNQREFEAAWEGAIAEDE